MSTLDTPPATQPGQASPGRRWKTYLGQLQIKRPRRAEPPPALDLDPKCTESPELLDFLAAVKALDRRLRFRRPESREEIAVLLQGAVNAARTSFRADGVDNLAVARATLGRAEAVFTREVQTKNRIYYVVGLGIGVCAVVFVPILLLWLAEAASNLSIKGATLPFTAQVQKGLSWLVKAAPLTTTAPLFFFAGLGASASVLSRLTTIDLRDETNRKMVLLAAGSRPALAVIFASVIFVILKNGIINVGGGDTTTQALIWVAAFLCGYSERFATDILDRVPFGGGSGPQPAGGAAAARPPAGTP